MSEGVQRCGQTFFLYQPGGLDQPPLAVLREAPFAKWIFVERNPCALDFDLSFVAPKIDNCAAQRFRSNQHNFHRAEHLPGRVSIGRFMHIH